MKSPPLAFNHPSPKGFKVQETLETGYQFFKKKEL
jgi:hypothetical protein